MIKYIDVEKLKEKIDKIRQDWVGESTGLEVGECGAELGAAESILDSIDDVIVSLQQSAIEEEREREREYREFCASYWKCVNNIIDKKRALPTFKGQLLHDFKNELHTMKQIVDLTNHPEINENLFDKLALVFATWGGYHFHPNNPPTEDFLQQDQPNNMIQWTGNNLKEVIDFTGKSPRFGEWFKSWEEYENYVHTHNDILKLFCENGSHYEVPVGAWIIKTPDGYNLPSVAKYIQQEQPEVDLKEEIAAFFSKNPIPHEHITDWPLLKNTALYFYELGFNARKEE